MVSLSRLGVVRGFMDLPVEIRHTIPMHFMTPVGFKTTRPFSVRKALYNEFYPLFITRYPLICKPIKRGHETVRHGLGRSDILKICYPHDDEKFRMHFFEEDWLEGIQTGVAELFDIDDRGEEDHLEELDEKEKLWGEDESERDMIKGCDINDMHATLSERGEQFSRYWIKETGFAKQLRSIGREEAAKIEKLEKHRGPWETNRMGECLRPGPYAVAIMSFNCSLFLPGLKCVTLHQRIFCLDEENYDAQDCGNGDYGAIFEPAESEDERWPEGLRVNIMSLEDDEESDAPQQYCMINTLRLLVDSCQELEVLE